jgi:ammonium transporter, Amt family
VTPNSGDTAWVLASAALVLLMTPGLAFFYGGMVRSKSVLNMLMMNFIALAVVGVLWVLYGFSLAFGNDIGGGLLGNLDFAGLSNTFGELVGFAVTTEPAVPWPGPDAIPILAFAMFQLMFAVITPALISGAVADRLKFWSWTIFIALWATIVYFPVAHWVFSFDGFVSADAVGGWIANVTKLGALDFAGGTAVHINAGAAGLALAIVLGRRRGWPKEPMRPHNLPFTLLGASLLWFGWFGFNAGSALTAGDLAATAFTNTMVATSAATIGWLIVEQFRDGKPTTLGAASGAVAGLVAITPASGFVKPMPALLIGLLAGIFCFWMVTGVKHMFGYDDTLDAFGVHGAGGTLGALLTGVFATNAINDAPINGKVMPLGLVDGNGMQILNQGIGVLIAIGLAAIGTFVILKVCDALIGVRVNRDSEEMGLDLSEHGEEGYFLDA